MGEYWESVDLTVMGRKTWDVTVAILEASRVLYLGCVYSIDNVRKPWKQYGRPHCS